MSVLPSLGTGLQRAGKNARIIIGGSGSGVSSGGATLAFANWNVTENTDDLDTGNFTSAGVSQTNPYAVAFGEGMKGFQTLSFDIGGLWDAGLNSYGGGPPGLTPDNYGNPVLPGLYVRDDLPGLTAAENVYDNIFWYLPYARVRSSQNGAEAKGSVTMKASGLSQGPYQYPYGNKAS